jgi:type IV secretion system pilin
MTMTWLLTLIADSEFGNTGFTPPSSAFNEGSDTDTGVVENIVKLLSNIIGLITLLGGLFFIVHLFLAAFDWLSAGGDSGKVEKARNRIMQSVLGLTLMVMTYSIIGIISRIVGIDLINLGDTIRTLKPTQ